MTTLLICNAMVLVTMDEQRREIKDGGLFIRDGVIEQVGETNTLPKTADKVLNLSGHVVIPGLVNTHHHLYQTLTRAVPAVQDEPLFGWLQGLYPIWARMQPEHIRVSTVIGLAELMRSGCTTSSDHLYIYPNACRLDDEIEGAQEIGMRFHAMRGSMSIGESDDGLPPDSVVEKESAILKDSQRLIEQWHNAERHSMLRVGLAPCSPFSVSRELMRDSAVLAREHGVRLHTHLAENIEDVEYSLSKFGMRPGDYASDLGWLGHDVWHTHCVQLDKREIDMFAKTGTGVVHCPTSNMRLGSGIAPIREMLDARVPVGIGVDGSASNDSSHLLAEARQSMLLQRVRCGASGLTAREAFEMATLGGAKVLGRDDIGALAPGMCADLAAFDVRGLDHAGALHDPVAALLLCQPVNASCVVVNGKLLIEEREFTAVELPVWLEQHQKLAMDLVAG